MDAKVLLCKMPHVHLEGQVRHGNYIHHDDAEFVIDQILEDFENRTDSNLKSSRQILGYIDGLAMNFVNEKEDNPLLKQLLDIRFYITTNIGQ